MAETYGVDAPLVALTAATAQYMLGLATASTVDCDLIDAAIGCDSVSGGSLRVELVSWTTDGTGTAYTPKQMNAGSFGRSSVTSAKVVYTVAPSGTIVVLKTWDLVLPTGPFELQWPLGREIHVPVSKFYGIRFTPSIGSINGYCHLQFEE